MKTLFRVSALAFLVATLSGVATMSASAATYTITQNFETANDGDLVQSFFSGVPITVSYAGFVDISWEPDTSEPQLAVGTNTGNKVIAGEDGPIIFQLAPDVNYESFSIDVIPASGASSTASYFLQTAAGGVSPAQTLDQTTPSTLTLTGLLESGYTTIVLPGGAQYDAVSLSATTVPEGSTAMLLLGGLATFTGFVVVKRRK